MNKKVGIVFLDDADDYYILQKIIMLNKENYDYVFFTYLLIHTLLMISCNIQIVQSLYSNRFLLTLNTTINSSIIETRIPLNR